MTGLVRWSRINPFGLVIVIVKSPQTDPDGRAMPSTPNTVSPKPRTVSQTDWLQVGRVTALAACGLAACGLAASTGGAEAIASTANAGNRIVNLQILNV
jgi:hypothetical protein